jgi:hypothetical protein
MAMELRAEHISSHLDNYEAARSAFFSLVVDDIDNLIKPSYKGEISDADHSVDGLTHAQDILRLNVVKCPIPHFSVKTEEYRRGNEVVKFATTPE